MNLDGNEEENNIIPQKPAIPWGTIVIVFVVASILAPLAFMAIYKGPQRGPPPYRGIDVGHSLEPAVKPAPVVPAAP